MNREGYDSRYTTGMQLYVAGESPMKWMVWDIMRGVDLLLERSDVNKDQIILLGAVAGGGDPAAVTAALYSRIAAVAPFNFGGATPEQGPGEGRWGAGLASPGSGSWETTRNLPHSIRDQFLPWLICASVAPRRFILPYEMGWDIEKVPVWTQYRKIFGLYDALDRLDEAHGFGTFPGPGGCANIGPSQRKTMYPELHRWFGIPIPAEEPNDRRPEAELAALTPAIADELKITPVHQLAYEIAELSGSTEFRPADRAAADPGDTIRVEGTCRERVVITTDKLKLEGARGVAISGFTIQGSLAEGILATHGAVFTVQNTIVQDNAGEGVLISDRSAAELPIARCGGVSLASTHSIRRIPCSRAT